MTTSEPLPEDPTLLRARIGELESKIAQLVAANEELKTLVAQFRRMIYGRRSERVTDQPGQGKLPFAAHQELVWVADAVAG